MYLFWMETHIILSSDYTEFAPRHDMSPKEWFIKAYDFSHLFYSHEIQRALAVKWEAVTPDIFFKEYVWVVHATGFSAKAVSKFINPLLEAYGSYHILADENENICLPRILNVCNNVQKAKAVKRTAGILKKGTKECGWEDFKKAHLSSVNILSKLPYIGNITKYHLGRNIGMLDCVKPDLHLIRMCKYWGYESCEQMICEISSGYDLPNGISDMIAWYYASTFGTYYMKKEGER